MSQKTYVKTMFFFVLFLRLRCARRSDAISSRQKIHPKIVYFFKILVVYELTLSPHPFQVH